MKKKKRAATRQHGSVAKNKNEKNFKLIKKKKKKKRKKTWAAFVQALVIGCLLLFHYFI